jgi:xylulokinase
MTVLLGLDVGTTGAKAILIDPAGRVRSTATSEYPLLTPAGG